jgi:hypothetical protein
VPIAHGEPVTRDSERQLCTAEAGPLSYDRTPSSPQGAAHSSVVYDSSSASCAQARPGGRPAGRDADVASPSPCTDKSCSQRGTDDGLHALCWGLKVYRVLSVRDHRCQVASWQSEVSPEIPHEISPEKAVLARAGAGAGAGAQIWPDIVMVSSPAMAQLLMHWDDTGQLWCEGLQLYANCDAC